MRKQVNIYSPAFSFSEITGIAWKKKINDTTIKKTKNIRETS